MHRQTHTELLSTALGDYLNRYKSSLLSSLPPSAETSSWSNNRFYNFVKEAFIIITVIECHDLNSISKIFHLAYSFCSTLWSALIVHSLSIRWRNSPASRQKDRPANQQFINNTHKWKLSEFIIHNDSNRVLAHIVFSVPLWTSHRLLEDKPKVTKIILKAASCWHTTPVSFATSQLLLIWLLCFFN